MFKYQRHSCPTISPLDSCLQIPLILITPEEGLAFLDSSTKSDLPINTFKSWSPFLKKISCCLWGANIHSLILHLQALLSTHSTLQISHCFALPLQSPKTVPTSSSSFQITIYFLLHLNFCEEEKVRQNGSERVKSWLRVTDMKLSLDSSNLRHPEHPHSPALLAPKTLSCVWSSLLTSSCTDSLVPLCPLAHCLVGPLKTTPASTHRKGTS